MSMSWRRTLEFIPHFFGQMTTAEPSRSKPHTSELTRWQESTSPNILTSQDREKLSWKAVLGGRTRSLHCYCQFFSEIACSYDSYAWSMCSTLTKSMDQIGYLLGAVSSTILGWHRKHAVRLCVDQFAAKVPVSLPTCESLRIQMLSGYYRGTHLW